MIVWTIQERQWLQISVRRGNLPALLISDETREVTHQGWDRQTVEGGNLEPQGAWGGEVTCKDKIINHISLPFQAVVALLVTVVINHLNNSKS